MVLGMSLTGCGRQAPYGSLDEVPEKLAADGTTVVVGDPSAVVTVHLYEDPRCPVCEEFETTGGGPELRKATLARDAATEYTLASFLDDRVGGSGSKKAVNALRAALEEGKFAEYHEVLYTHQPEEAVDGFTDAYLLELADQVDGLRGPAFDSAVKTMKYRAFVTASEKAYERAGGKKEPEGPGTPTAVVNDVRIPVDYNGLLFDASAFTGLLELIGERPEEWQDYAF
ncbi:DsbA family protein [Streptomyces sp. NBC_00457]|uniref:DsbA family protein n=1 Tax=unclassified Streptomyces TaxID=2593676 RepID=UPI002E1A3535|nr:MULTISPECIES: thioredoxin domain-containing protein [unclassified Streptomyces]